MWLGECAKQRVLVACWPQMAKTGRVPAQPPLGMPRCRPCCPPGAARVLVPLGKLANPMARKAAPHDSPVKGNRVSDLSGKHKLSPQMHCSRQQKELRRLAPCSAQEEERRRGGCVLRHKFNWADLQTVRAQSTGGSAKGQTRAKPP